MALIRRGLPVSPGFSYVSIGWQGLSLLCTVPVPACAEEMLLLAVGGGAAQRGGDRRGASGVPRLLLMSHQQSSA